VLKGVPRIEGGRKARTNGCGVKLLQGGGGNLDSVCLNCSEVMIRGGQFGIASLLKLLTWGCLGPDSQKGVVDVGADGGGERGGGGGGGGGGVGGVLRKFQRVCPLFGPRKYEGSTPQAPAEGRRELILIQRGGRDGAPNLFFPSEPPLGSSGPPVWKGKTQLACFRRTERKGEGTVWRTGHPIRICREGE